MLACAAMITPAQAQTADSTSKPRAVLFKLHEIKPVMNAEGEVTHCDFMATFYNRTEESLRQAKLELGWNDTVSDKYMAKEKKKESKAENKNSRASAKVEKDKLAEIVTSVDMPALGSYKQVSVKASVKTEKCFLLLDNLEFRVNYCSVVSKDADNSYTSRRRMVANREAPSECANLFEYIDSQNPEYYDEFKNISFSEQERLIIEDRKTDISDLEKSYDSIVQNFEKAEKIIKNIQ